MSCTQVQVVSDLKIMCEQFWPAGLIQAVKPIMNMDTASPQVLITTAGLAGISFRCIEAVREEVKGMTDLRRLSLHSFIW